MGQTLQVRRLPVVGAISIAHLQRCWQCAREHEMKTHRSIYQQQQQTSFNLFVLKSLLPSHIFHPMSRMYMQINVYASVLQCHAFAPVQKDKGGTDTNLISLLL